jgi:hypothetical protein
MRIDPVDVYTPGAVVTCYCYFTEFKAVYPPGQTEAHQNEPFQAVVLSFHPIG